MNTNIDLSNINKHFFNKIKDNENNENNENNEISKKYRTKIINYCFNSINEANISDIIKSIPYYSNNYSIVEDYDYININQLNEKYIDKLTLTNNEKYLIFSYNNDKCIAFNDFLFNLTTPKQFIFYIIESFSYILKSLIKLNGNDICFFNLSPRNIVFNLNCGEKTIIQNFQLSLQIPKLNESYITNIINKLDDYTYKPLEVHVLFYLIKNDFNTISYSFIEEICEVYTNNLSVLSFFSDKYREFYKNSCIVTLKRYINKPKTEIILDILNKNNKWDVFSISVLYLHIFYNISRIFSLKQTFINKIILELSKNIDPNPLKRSSLEGLLKYYDKLFNDENDWTYINKLPRNMMSQLFNNLDK
jgi:hypothetical protein